MSDPDQDDPSTATGPSYRMTGPAHRGTSRPATRTAQAAPEIEQKGMDVAERARKESLQEIAQVKLNDPTTWPADPAKLHSRVFQHPRGRIKLMHVRWATLEETRFGFRATHAKIEVQSVMADDKALKFLARFILPLLKYNLGRHHLAKAMTGRHPVGVLWATGDQRFGRTGTVAKSADPSDASNPAKGSPSLIFIDEHGKDWRAVPDLDEMPDVGFFHELFHAEMNEQGRNDQMTEREARIEENRYRNVRGASSHRTLP